MRTIKTITIYVYLLMTVHVLTGADPGIFGWGGGGQVHNLRIVSNMKRRGVWGSGVLGDRLLFIEV